MMDLHGTGNLPFANGRLGRAGTGMAKIRARRNMLFLLLAAGWPAAATPWALVGCKKSPSAASAAEGLPPFTAEEAALFDDRVAPVVFGLSEGRGPSRDPNFYDRLKRADAVLHGRISTVTEEALAGRSGYALSVAVEGTVRGSVTERVLELRIPPGSTGLARMQASSAALVGKRIVLFIRRFARGDDVELHFHAEADDAATREALKRGKPLDETDAEEHTR